MSSRKLFSELVASVQHSMNAAHRYHVKELQSKQKALVAYQKMNSLKLGKTWSAEEEAMAMDKVGKQMGLHIKPSTDTTAITHLDKEDSLYSEIERHHVTTASLFLASQTEYCELLERYNPGISMKQTDKVRKTARRVGLEVPE
ncbi:hypothetical protein DAMA08_006980 [Martiniozyma asiatica (nom. inval.)]|nr:hypothetical protein DAMA08_006980 [Martiniozyma asiatica]